MMVEIPANFHPVGKDADGLALLANELLVRTSLTKERQRGHFIPFGRDDWIATVGYRYGPIKREAIRCGLIDENPRYSVGRFTKSIRFNKQFRHGQMRRHLLRRPKSICRIRLDETDSVGHWLCEKFRHFAIAVDPKSRDFNHWVRFAIGRLDAGDYYATRCEYRRFHSTFTSLPRIIRTQLHVHGCEVVEIDVAGAQPLIIGVLCRDRTISDSNSPGGPTTPYNHMCCASDDLERFIRVCASGCIYGEILAAAIRDGLSYHSVLPARFRSRQADRPLNRKDVKRAMLTATFAPNQTMRRMPLFKVFAREFPTVASFIEQAKEHQHQALARQCQRFESELIIDTVSKRLMEIDDGIPMFTVHDSIVTVRQHQELVANEIRQAFSTLGVTPTIRSTDRTGNVID